LKGIPVSDAEKRSNNRYSVRLPVRFRARDKADEISAEALNMSRSGLFIACPEPVAVGSSISMLIRIPIEVSGRFHSELRCEGRVVHERPAEGASGYGIHIVRMNAGSYIRSLLSEAAEKLPASTPPTPTTP
jgi:hypothetical protein